MDMRFHEQRLCILQYLNKQPIICKCSNFSAYVFILKHSSFSFFLIPLRACTKIIYLQLQNNIFTVILKPSNQYATTVIVQMDIYNISSNFVIYKDLPYQLSGQSYSCSVFIIWFLALHLLCFFSSFSLMASTCPLNLAMCFSVASFNVILNLLLLTHQSCQLENFVLDLFLLRFKHVIQVKLVKETSVLSFSDRGIFLS